MVISTIQSAISGARLPILLILGIVTMTGFFFGKGVKIIKLPSIIGYMIAGVIAGPSLLGIIGGSGVSDFTFITEIALGFVALTIGMELKLSSLKQFGAGIIIIILFESLLAFIVVTGGIYLLTGNLPLALLFGAIAPASAPAGTVAVIQEYQAKGSLTNALYAVVGFDDGFGIIIFGFAAAIAKSLITADAGGETAGFLSLMAAPLTEVGLSFLVGGAASLLYCFIAARLANSRDVFILTFAVVLIIIGLSTLLHLSIILTNMILGFVAVNTQRSRVIHNISSEIKSVMPLLFVLFFVLAGANLHLSALPSLGIIGLVYILCRSAGLMSGASLGGIIGKAEGKIKKYLGMGILSQAGVAIGLALIVKQEITPMGEAGSYIGNTVITTITATSIFFELIGPVLTKIGLKKAGEIPAGKK